MYICYFQQNLPNTAVASTSAVNRTTGSESVIPDENFMKLAEKVSELATNWDLQSITAELKKFNNMVEEKNFSTLEKYSLITESLINLAKKFDSS